MATLEERVDKLETNLSTAESRIATLESWRDEVVDPTLADHEARLHELERWRIEEADPTLADHGARIAVLEESRLAVRDAFLALLAVLLSETGTITWQQYHRILTGDEEDVRAYFIRTRDEIGELVVENSVGNTIDDRPLSPQSEL